MRPLSAIGFRVSDEEKKKKLYEQPTFDAEKPVRSVAKVSFPGGPTLSYYNDCFDLKPGDRVFVSGKYAGKPGTVHSVTTKFKINLADFEKVIACPELPIRGTYRRVLDMMVSFDAAAVSPARFRNWAIAPKEDDADDEIIVGDGYEVPLAEFERDDEVSEAILSRAVDYLSEGRVRYIAMRDGTVTAFVEGSSFYEVNFRLEKGDVTELYCDCPFPGFCKHAAAVLYAVRVLLEEFEIDELRQFTAFDDNFFWYTVAQTKKEITL